MNDSIQDTYLKEDANIFGKKKAPTPNAQQGKQDEFTNSLSQKEHIQPCSGVTFTEGEKVGKTGVVTTQKFVIKGPEYDYKENDSKMSMQQYKTMQGFSKFGSEKTPPPSNKQSKKLNPDSD